MMKKVSHKDNNKRITIRDNGNVQSHDKEVKSFSVELKTALQKFIGLIVLVSNR